MYVGVSNSIMAGSSAVGTVIKGGGGLFSKIFKIKFAYIFIIILFIQAIAVGITSGEGAVGVVQALGERFFNVTQGLQATSLQVIENGAIFTSWWAFLGTLWSLFSNVWLIYLWLKLFIWFWGRYNDSQKLLNYILGTLTFLVLQIFYLFLLANPLDGQSKVDLFLSPIFAFVDFFKATILIFSSLGFQKAVESGLNLTKDVCVNPSGCVI